MGFLITVLLVVIVIAGALSNYWDVIESLPESSAAFLGALVGVGGGLVAILAGAFANAGLNRKRDDRLRNAEIDAVTNALVAELMTVQSFSRDHAIRLRHEPRATFKVLVAGRPLGIPVFEKMTGQQLGLLNSEALKKLVEVRQSREILTRILEESVDPDNPNLHELASDENLERLSKRHTELADAAVTAARALNSFRPKL